MTETHEDSSDAVARVICTVIERLSDHEVGVQVAEEMALEDVAMALYEAHRLVLQAIMFGDDSPFPEAA